jgi:predicted DNA-binding transcriptional regulator AlpA
MNHPRSFLQPLGIRAFIFLMGSKTSQEESKTEVAMQSELLTPAELAARLQTPTAVLANWRYKGTGPKFVKIGGGIRGNIRYRASDVEAWLDAQTRTQTGPALASA